MEINACHIGDCRALMKDMAAAGVRAQTCVTLIAMEIINRVIKIEPIDKS